MKIRDECERVWQKFCDGGLHITKKKEKKELHDQALEIQYFHSKKLLKMLGHSTAFDKVLDLHGMDRDKAYEAFSLLLKEMYLNGERLLLLITGGKALSSNMTSNFVKSHRHGILRELFNYWITFPEVKQYVTQCVVALQRDGGNGAFYIFVKKRIEEDI
ncbi:Smr/MutS family protein [Candidatus Fokinia crypta]|uniref:Smr domain protein n=1 Tax=Candidatus Fokinia crypta TaxID=1920990 RepID=A0ABZ0UNC5_9RICK|nr:Smr/MutS family protein [Candidatus Fokinia cryptica]WPX97630.1 Smr domain protein [Candidatus Fokinia cryptica]